MKYLKQIIFHSLYLIFYFIPFVSLAADPKTYTLLAPIGGISETSGFSTYINTAIQFTMGAGTGLSVLMIAVGGIQMILAAGNTSKMGEGKQKIQNAILGLVILAISALILNTINPDLLNIGLI